MDRKKAEIELHKFFGHTKFYKNQWEIIEEITKNSVLIIQQTGFGKSLCYQFPSLFLEGITLVFSPLIALMRDQISFLKSKGIAAECLNSDNTDEENNNITKLALKNSIKLLYVAPERQNSSNWNKFINQLNISMIVIDEAHCISVWGHDFRPSYKKIVNTISKINHKNKIPVMALTATANQRIEMDIKNQIGKFTLFRGGLYRSNLHLNAININNFHDKMAMIADIVTKEQGVGIIFAGTKNSAEYISSFLKYLGINSTFYHSKVVNREDIELDTINDKFKVIVATNAFGMGIDKSDFRFIIHEQFPASMIHYYQEIGRAGRDGKISKIYLLWNKGDLELQEYFINSAKPPIEQYQNVIAFIKEYPKSRSFEIETSLDLGPTSVKNILQDLEEQSCVSIIEEFKEKPVIFMINIYDSQDYSIINIDLFNPEQQILIYELLKKENTIHSLSKIILGNVKNSSKNTIHQLIESINTIDPIIENRIERSKSTFYSLTNEKFNEAQINSIRDYKHKLLKDMMNYLLTSKCRMKVICNGLEDFITQNCDNCDNCLQKDSRNFKKNFSQEISNLYLKKLEDFNIIRYSKIPLVYAHERDKDLKNRKSKLVDGLACIFNKKTDFNDLHVDQLVEMVKLSKNRYDLLLFIPSEINEKYASKIASKLLIPLSKSLEIVSEINFDHWYNRKKSLKSAFIYNDLENNDLENKNILLFDTICNTGFTIQAAGNYLSKFNPIKIKPIFFVKTIK